MNVLSLFDGMSCGQIALNKMNIPYENYFACEIKKHAIEVTQHNYPNTIQLGDVRKVKVENLPKIDLLIGGSPCQDFSRANKVRDGLEGEKSSLFFEYIRLLKECKPKYFLLENVIMDKYNQDFISNELNCEPVRLCGSLVSAALRDRLYWTNIPPFSYDLTGRIVPQITQPKDERITLQSILTSGYTNKRKHTCLNTGSGSPYSPKSLEHRDRTTGMVTVIFDNDRCVYNENIRQLNQAELERCHNIPEGYTSILNQRKSGDLIGDGWTVDIVCHIFKGLK